MDRKARTALTKKGFCCEAGYFSVNANTPNEQIAKELGISLSQVRRYKKHFALQQLDCLRLPGCRLT